jgi:hypothetical protein
MIVLLQDRAGFHARHVHLRDRILAWLRAPSLDRQLAEGAAPESNLNLAIEAERLIRPAQRRVLAGSLKRIVAGVERELASNPPLTAPVARADVRRARPEIESLAQRLQSPGPVNVRGVARVRLLLSDGTGPLYRSGGPLERSARPDRSSGGVAERGRTPGPTGDLRTELRAAMTAMDPLR